MILQALHDYYVRKSADEDERTLGRPPQLYAEPDFVMRSRNGALNRTSCPTSSTFC